MHSDTFRNNYIIWSKSALFGIKIQIYSDFYNGYVFLYHSIQK